MKLRVLLFGMAATWSLFAQHHRFSWQEECFKNPGAPYCPGHEYAVKPTKGNNRTSSGGGSYLGTLPATIDAAGIDWRFADPSADAVAVLSGRKLSASPLAHSLLDQLAASQGLRADEIEKVYRGLAGPDQIALSIRDGMMVLMVIGRAPDSILPAPEAGWKAMSLEGGALLIGHADAVNQAAQRMAVPLSLGDLAGAALQRQTDGEFWAIGSAKLVGPDAVAAGVKRFSLTASLRDGLTIDTIFEYEKAPDPNSGTSSLKSSADAQIVGNVMHRQETLRSFDQIAGSPLGQRLAPFIQSARYLPVRDTATTVHTKPVIFGLDDGPREAKQ